MKSKINADGTLEIPMAVIIELGWNLNEEVLLDIPVGGGSIIIYKPDSPAQRLVVSSVVNKSRDYRACE